MFFRHRKNVLLRQDNSKTKLRSLENVLHWLGRGFTKIKNKDVVRLL